MRSMFRWIADLAERAKGLDPTADAVAKVSDRLVPQGVVKDGLAGTWLGHPLHPALTDLTLGAWISAGLLDLFGGEESRPAAQRLVALGILSAIPTAAAGLADWVDTEGAQRRVGFVHGTGNVGVLGLFGLSWLARRRGRHASGVVLAMLANGTAVATAYLGGHMSFGQGVGVDETTFEAGPKMWKALEGVTPAKLDAGRPVRGTVGQVRVMAYKAGDRVYALSDRCSHRGCALASGTVHGEGDDAAIECPCHGSTFRLVDGQILRGPATAPQPAYEARINAEKVEVRLRQ
jgi:nitrite reductase/ring-hydroxylating ferredoxin subunit/uncharacterized membrane protein